MAKVLKPRCPLCSKIMGQYARYCKAHMLLMPDELMLAFQLSNNSRERAELHRLFVEHLAKSGRV